MLKRRILASSMASVMALTSIASVAFADETDYGQAVSKSELQKYVDSFDSFRNDGIFDYGSVQGQYFQDAIDYAENVLADDKATAEDYTAAYQMVKAVRDNMRNYSTEELEALLKQYKAIFESNNILNEELGDNIYDPDTFETFAGAYSSAESYVGSGDGRLITDAYMDLENGYKGLKELDTITKSEFRAVLKQFENIITKKSSYESWRRGTCSVAPTTGNNNNAGKVTEARYVSFEQLLDIVYGASTVTLVNTAPTADDGTATWINVGEEGTVEGFVKGKYDAFDAIKSSTVTSDTEIVNAFKAAKDAVAVFAGWEEDNTKRATKANATALLDTYHNRLVLDYNQEDAAGIINAVNTGTDDWSDLNGDGDVTADNAKVLVTGGVYLTLSSENPYAKKWIDKGEGEYSDLVSTTNVSGAQKVSKGGDLLKYVAISAELITGDVHDAGETELAAGLVILETYLTTNYKDEGGPEALLAAIEDIDENKTVSKATGSVTEWTLINRYIKYALDDMYPDTAADATYTKKDVSDLIEKAYELAEETGDAAIFNAAHMDLVNARKAALEWVTKANADKTYKDGNAVAYIPDYEIEDGKYISGGDLDTKIPETAGAENGISVTSTTAYTVLKGYYDELANQLADYQYSYGEIAKQVARIGIAIDNKAVEPSEALLTALKDCAYALSTLEVCDYEEEDNPAFDSDRIFQVNNRLHTDNKTGTGNPNGAEKILKAAYEKLVGLYETAIGGEGGLLGDANGDNKLSAADATAILVAIAAGADAVAKLPAVADYTGDGKINVADATAILVHLAGN